jgi:hypothetical protein
MNKSLVVVGAGMPLPVSAVDEPALEVWMDDWNLKECSCVDCWQDRRTGCYHPLVWQAQGPHHVDPHWCTAVGHPSCRPYQRRMVTLVAEVVRMRNLDLRSVHFRVVLLPAFVGVAEGEVERRENNLGNWQTRRMKTDGVCYCRG